MPCISGELPAGDRTHAHGAVGHRLGLRVNAGAVEQQFDVRLLHHLAPHNAVPYRVAKSGVAVDVFLFKLRDNAGLAVVKSLGAAYPHAYLA